MSIEERIVRLVRGAVAHVAGELGFDGEPPGVELTKPRQREHGDFATNVALIVASRTGSLPRDVAGTIVAAMPEDPGIRGVEVAGPGFINFFVTEAWLHDALREAVTRGDRYGWADAPSGRRVQVEFVSANPTGPLTIGHARNAAIGDALARVLEASGWSVEREYYFNDAGGQMDRFGASVEARYLQLLSLEVEMPEDGYHGDYVVEIARDILESEGPGLADLPAEQRFDRLLAEGSRRALHGIRTTLDRFGVRFDTFMSERELQERGEIASAVDTLRSAGHAYEAEGAIWFRASAFGDDKDRVVVRSNGRHTYFGADCAYLIDKFGRGFDHLIYVLGADHHGDVARLKGAAQGLGFDPQAVEIILYQFVSFLRGGEPVTMSKRAGAFVSLDELIDEVGADAARFTLLQHSNDSAMNFDIELVKQQTMDNPVYYVQYGHARIASILRKAAERGVVLEPLDRVDLSLLSSEEELELLRAVAAMPEQVAQAAEHRGPHRLTHYAQGLATRFHRFYTERKVVSDDVALTQARLWLCRATQQTIANLLSLLGVSAPLSMDREEA